MSWIESHQSLSRHRKTLRAVALLKVDRHKLIGHLHELWWWGLDNASRQGDLGGVTPIQIANGAGWPERDADRFVDALLDAGFLEHDERGYRLHDWYDYAGKFNDQREQRRMSNRAAQHRRRQRMSSMTNADVSTPSSMTNADVSTPSSMTNADVSTCQQSTGPNLTKPNQTLPPYPPSDPRKGGASEDFENGHSRWPTGVQP